MACVEELRALLERAEKGLSNQVRLYEELVQSHVAAMQERDGNLAALRERHGRLIDSLAFCNMAQCRALEERDRAVSKAQTCGLWSAAWRRRFYAVLDKQRREAALRGAVRLWRWKPPPVPSSDSDSSTGEPASEELASEESLASEGLAESEESASLADAEVADASEDLADEEESEGESEEPPVPRLAFRAWKSEVVETRAVVGRFEARRRVLQQAACHESWKRLAQSCVILRPVLASWSEVCRESQRRRVDALRRVIAGVEKPSAESAKAVARALRWSKAPRLFQSTEEGCKLLRSDHHLETLREAKRAILSPQVVSVTPSKVTMSDGTVYANRHVDGMDLLQVGILLHESPLDLLQDWVAKFHPAAKRIFIETSRQVTLHSGGVQKPKQDAVPVRWLSGALQPDLPVSFEADLGSRRWQVTHNGRTFPVRVLSGTPSSGTDVVDTADEAGGLVVTRRGVVLRQPGLHPHKRTPAKLTRVTDTEVEATTAAGERYRFAQVRAADMTQRFVLRNHHWSLIDLAILCVPISSHGYMTEVCLLARRFLGMLGGEAVTWAPNCDLTALALRDCCCETPDYAMLDRIRQAQGTLVGTLQWGDVQVSPGLDHLRNLYEWVPKRATGVPHVSVAQWIALHAHQFSPLAFSDFSEHLMSRLPKHQSAFALTPCEILKECLEENVRRALEAASLPESSVARVVKRVRDDRAAHLWFESSLHSGVDVQWRGGQLVARGENIGAPSWTHGAPPEDARLRVVGIDANGAVACADGKEYRMASLRTYSRFPLDIVAPGLAVPAEKSRHFASLMGVMRKQWKVLCHFQAYERGVHLEVLERLTEEMVESPMER